MHVSLFQRHAEPFSSDDSTPVRWPQPAAAARRTWSRPASRQPDLPRGPTRTLFPTPSLPTKISRHLHTSPAKTSRLPPARAGPTAQRDTRRGFCRASHPADITSRRASLGSETPFWRASQQPPPPPLPLGHRHRHRPTLTELPLRLPSGRRTVWSGRGSGFGTLDWRCARRTKEGHGGSRQAVHDELGVGGHGWALLRRGLHRGEVRRSVQGACTFARLRREGVFCSLGAGICFFFHCARRDFLPVVMPSSRFVSVCFVKQVIED